MRGSNVTERRCNACGEKFSLTPIELRHYQQIDLSVPIYCRKCRNMAQDAIDHEGIRPGILQRSNLQ